MLNGTDMPSEIAQCHFLLHYPSDESVRRGMNERSACVCFCAEGHAFVIAWLLLKRENVWTQLFVFLRARQACDADVASTHSHNESAPFAVPPLHCHAGWYLACALNPHATPHRRLSQKGKKKKSVGQCFDRTDLNWRNPLQDAGHGLKHPFPAVSKCYSHTRPPAAPPKHPASQLISDNCFP